MQFKKKIDATAAKRQREYRERKKAEVQALRDTVLRLQRQLERLTGKSCVETAERRQ
jgi:hypothetical protein